VASKTLFPDQMVQKFLKDKGFYHGTIDGQFLQQSHDAMVAYLNTLPFPTAKVVASRLRLATEQTMLIALGYHPGLIDGLWGQQTQDAWERWQNDNRDKEGETDLGQSAIVIPARWPLQKDVRRFFGEPGQNLVTLQSPYPLRIAWDTKTSVSHFAIHEKCHDPALRVMQRVLNAYQGVENLQRLGLDLFGGCYMNRMKKGGNTLSMHAWGIAIDWDPEHNQFRWGANKARMDDPEYDKFLDLWAEEGFLSLGRAANYDWMHVQAARLH
jgi:hypothetical protein